MKTDRAWFNAVVHTGNTWIFETKAGPVTGRIASVCETVDMDGNFLKVSAKLTDGTWIAEGVDVRDAAA